MAVTILLLGANPSNTSWIAIHREFLEIERQIRAANHGYAFQVVQQSAVRATEIQEHLLRHRPAIVHFSGHGSADGELLLEDESGEAKPISTAALGNILGILRQGTRCVVLNACFSEAQARAIADHVDAVVAMTAPIENRAAVEFSRAFYQALGYGKDIQTAFELGRSQGELVAPGHADVPRLLVRDGIRASTIRFVGARAFLADGRPWPLPRAAGPRVILALLLAALLLGLALGDVGSPSLRLFGVLTGGAIIACIAALSASRIVTRCRYVIGLAFMALLSYGLTVASLKRPTLTLRVIGMERREELARKVQQMVRERLYGHGEEVASKATLDALEIFTNQNEILIAFRTLRTLHDGGTVLQRDGRDLREGGLKRVYEGKVIYAGTYTVQGNCLKIDNLDLRDYALAPTGPFLSRLMGWWEIDHSMRNHEKTFLNPLLNKFREVCG